MGFITKMITGVYVCMVPAHSSLVYSSFSVLQRNYSVMKSMNGRRNFSTFQRNNHTGSIVFGKVTPKIMKDNIPVDFLEELMKMGKSEDDIIEYYTKYHNENNFIFLNRIEELLAKNENLTKTDAFAIWSYTTNHYYWDFNNWMRNGINVSYTEGMARLVENALEKMPTYSGPAYRALGISDNSIMKSFLEQHDKGKTVRYNYFVSAGNNIEAAFFDKPEKNVFFQMNVAKAPVISDFSDGIIFRGYKRDELLLKIGRIFVIVSYKKVNDKHYFELTEKIK